MPGLSSANHSTASLVMRQSPPGRIRDAGRRELKSRRSDDAWESNDGRFEPVHRQYPSRSNHGEQQVMRNTFATAHSAFARQEWPWSLSSILAWSASASNSAICRRISAISRSRDSRGPDQLPAQIKEVCNRLQRSCTIIPAKPFGVRSDGEVRRPVGSEQFVQTGSVEFHAMPTRPYPMIGAFGMHDNSQSNF